MASADAALPDEKQASSAEREEPSTLGDREATMRDQIRKLQEQRALAMKEEITRLEGERDLFAAKYQLLEAQVQQTSQEASMQRGRLGRLQEDLEKQKQRTKQANDVITSEQLHSREAERQAKEAVARNGTLLLKLKRLETERAEQRNVEKELKERIESLSKDGTTLPAYVRDALTEARDTVASQRVELRQCAQSLEDERRHSHQLCESNKLYVSNLKHVQGQMESIREEQAECRRWVQGKLAAIAEEMEAAKVIYSLHNSLSMEQASMQELHEKLDNRTKQLLHIREENRALKAELDKFHLTSGASNA